MFGVPVTSIPIRTIAHLDAISFEVLSVYEGTMTQFFLGQEVVPLSPSLRTPGGILFELLDRETPPDAALMEAILADLPDGPVNEELRLALLWLTLATGNAALALGFIDRLVRHHPDDRNTVYARVALLRDLNRTDEAISVATHWNSRRPDPSIRGRAQKRLRSNLRWENRKGLYLNGEGLELAIDVAIDRMFQIDA